MARDKKTCTPHNEMFCYVMAYYEYVLIACCVRKICVGNALGCAGLAGGSTYQCFGSRSDVYIR